ncbi:MAG: hypothetical protein Q8Q60_00120 [Candidatus Chromulinivorax sp.]|nr:hypothetical protein [Candidatus Chromulinivorax sp.]
MKNIQMHTLRKLREMQLLSLLLVGFSAITAMDADNMFGMYDAAEDSSDSSEVTAMNENNIFDMYDAYDSSDESSFGSIYSSPSSVNNELDKKNYGILHKTVDNLNEENNVILLDFYDETDRQISDQEIRDFDKKHQRLKRRLEEMGSVIEGTRKNGKSELFQLLPKNQNVEKYDVMIDGLVNPKTGKIEFNSHIDVLLNSNNSDADDDQIITVVNKIKKDLKRYYNIKKVGYDVEKEERVE